MSLELLDLAPERIEILELVVHGGEADVGHLVEITQLRHHPFTEKRGRQLAFGITRHADEQPPDERLDRLRGNRPLFERAIDPRPQLVFRKRLPPAVALDDLENAGFHLLGGIETLAAALAGAAAADDAPFRRLAGLDHPGLPSTAVGAAHGKVLRRRRDGRGRGRRPRPRHGRAPRPHPGRRGDRRRRWPRAPHRRGRARAWSPPGCQISGRSSA